MSYEVHQIRRALGAVWTVPMPLDLAIGVCTGRTPGGLAWPRLAPLSWLELPTLTSHSVPLPDWAYAFYAAIDRIETW